MKPEPLKGKPEMETKDVCEYCTFCKKEVDIKNVGAPISGDCWVCRDCGRPDADDSSDGLGMIRKERNVIKWKKKDDIRSAVELHLSRNWVVKGTMRCLECATLTNFVNNDNDLCQRCQANIDFKDVMK